MSTRNDRIGEALSISLIKGAAWSLIFGFALWWNGDSWREVILNPRTDTPAAVWVPVVNPHKPEVGGYAPTLYRAEMDGQVCFLAVNTFDDSLSCVPVESEQPPEPDGDES